MNSFYGGKEGRSYAIIKHFDTIDAMKTAFKKGAGYSEVSYGEYVIIDTILNLKNPNHPDNGKIYRRGLNYNADGGGAIYVGQIKGADGSIPPMHFISIDELNQYNNITVVNNTTYTCVNSTTYQIIDPGSILSLLSFNKDSIYSDGTTNTIELGYKTIADEDGSNRQGLIGLDIPKPVVRLSAIIVEPSTNATYSHIDIKRGAPDTSNVDFENPIHQATLSSSAMNNGIQYLDYQIAIPKSISNLDIKSNAATDTNGIVITPFDYELSYDTIKNNAATKESITTNIDLPARIEYQGNVLSYRTNKGYVQTLGNPNGQFKIFALLKATPVEGTTFSNPSDIISYLNNSSTYKYGVRIPYTQNNTTYYDLTQAGWVIAGNYIVQLGTEQILKTSLFAFDYRKANDNSLYQLNNLTTVAPTDSLSLKGWFNVQDFDSSLTNSPESSVLIGTPSDLGSDFGNISVDERTELQTKGVWFKTVDLEDKWWL